MEKKLDQVDGRFTQNQMVISIIKLQVIMILIHLQKDTP